MIPGRTKADIDSYFDQAKTHNPQLKKMGPAKRVMALWVVWKKPIKLLIKLDPEDAKNAQGLDDGTVGDIYHKKIEMPFKSLMSFLMPVTSMI